MLPSSYSVSSSFSCSYLYSISSILLAVCCLKVGQAFANQKPRQERISNLTEFEATLAELHQKTKAWVEYQGAQLEINGLWNEEKPNASAGQRSPSGGNIWTVNMNGGLARDPNVTKDAFILTYCHELGHHFGGFPFFKDTNVGGMSIEGQADYYSTRCLKTLWKSDHIINKRAELFVNSNDLKKCDEAKGDLEARQLCYRIMNAIRSKEKWYTAYDQASPGKYDGPIGPDVSETYEAHPNHACRVETMEAGYFCDVIREPYIIPGKNSSFSAHGREAELAAASVSCMKAEGLGFGFRPHCWFKPQFKILVGLEQAQVKELAGNLNDILEPGEIFEVVSHLKNFSNSGLNQSVEFRLVKGDGYSLVDVPVDSVSRLQSQDVYKSKPMIFKISKDVSCGESIELNFEFKTKNITEKQAKVFKLGKVERSPLKFSQNRRAKIPDVNSFGQYGKSSINVNSLDHSIYDRAYLKFDFHHQNRADLLAYLISPKGKRYLAFEKRAIAHTAKDYEFEVPINEEDINGSWRLEIRDLIPTNKGTLKSWELSFGRSRCGIK